MPADTIARALAQLIPAQVPAATISRDVAPTVLPLARLGAGVTSDAAGNVYVVGGDGANTATGTTTVYRIAADTGAITTLPALPVPLMWTTAAVDGSGRLYAIAGYSSGTMVASAYRLEPGASAWTAIASLPATRQQGRALTDAVGRVYYLGGGDANGPGTSTVYRFDPAGGGWTTLNAMPGGRSNFAAGSTGSLLYIAGGIDNTSTAVNTAARFDMNTGTWSSLSGLPAAVLHVAGACDAAGRFYVVGGASGATALSTVQRFDPATGTWSTQTAAALGTARYWHGVARDGAGRLVIVGGTANGSAAMTSIERITPEDPVLAPLGWSTLLSLSAARQGANVSTDGTNIYVTGGFLAGTATTSALTITPAGTITTATAAFNSVGHAGTAWLNGRHYVLGGNAAGVARTACEFYTPAGTNGAAGTWGNITALPQNRAHAAAAAVGTYLYLAGGTASVTNNLPNASGVLTSFIRYNTASGNAASWETLPGLPVFRFASALVALGTKLYLIGGTDNTNTAQATMHVYDTAAGASGTWAAAPSMPGILSAMTATVLGGRIYALGAGAAAGTTVYVFDGTSWSTAPGIPAALHNWSTAVAIGSTLYAVSGQNTAAVDALDTATAGTSAYQRRVKALQQYLAATDVPGYAAARRIPGALDATWRTLRALDAVFLGAAVSTDGTRIYVTHGSSGSGTTPAGRSVATDGTQATLPVSTISRAYVAGVWCGGRHYAIGGCTSTFMHTTVEAYTPAGANGAAGTWATVTSLPAQRAGAAAAAVGTFLYVAGGSQQQSGGAPTAASAQSTVTRYNTTAGNAGAWETVTSLPAARYGGALVAVGTRLYYIGGFDSAATMSTTVWSYDTAAGAAGTWSVMAPVPVSESSPRMAAVVGSTIYLPSTMTAGRFFALDTTTGQWRTHNVSGQAVAHADYAAAAAIGSTLYLVSGAGTANVDAIDTAAVEAVAVESWRTLASTSTSRQYPGMAVAGGKLYVVGGQTPDGTSHTSLQVIDTASGAVTLGPAAGGSGFCTACWWGDRMAVFFGSGVFTTYTPAAGNPTAGTWAGPPAPGGARYYASLAALGSDLYLAGGTASTAANATNQVQRFNGTAWVNVAFLPAVRYNGAMGAVGGKLYYLGGQDTLNGQLTVFSYDPGANAWTSLGAVLPARPAPGASAVPIGSRLIFPSTTGQLYAYDPASNTCATLGPVGPAHGQFVATAGDASRVFITGGEALSTQFDALNVAQVGTTDYARRVRRLRAVLAA